MRIVFIITALFLMTRCTAPIQSTMKHLSVKKINLKNDASLEDIKANLDSSNINFEPIDIQNWKEFSYKPEVQFRIAHNGSEILLQYKVKEKYILANCNLADDSCWPNNDSCVEFFFSPNSNDEYTNFEFSCIGYCLFMTGNTKDRQRLPLSITEKIRRHSTLGTQTFTEKEGDFAWTLTIAIPSELIVEKNRANLSGQTWRANFYKCGDKLKERHYLTWSPINWKTPNYHLPEQFGQITFE